MLNFGQLVNTVQKNCHISDAAYADNYTLCVFLLKMREYYRWENQIPLTQSLPKNEIGDWLAERERTWDHLESDEFAPLQLERREHDPFDAEAVNKELLPLGYVYSSGNGLHNKPHFFLGNLVRKERAGDITILVSSCEYARDLVAPPSMLRDHTVFVRQESLRRFLWEKLEDWHWNQKKTDHPMARAVACYGANRDMEQVLDVMTENETESLILHEIGEARAGNLLGPRWEEMLAAFPRSKAEYLARATRDLLADSLSTLPKLLEDENQPSLHVYFANFTGMRKYLFPQLGEAYRGWAEGGDLARLRETVRRGSDYWQTEAQSVLTVYQESGSADAVVELLKSKIC